MKLIEVEKCGSYKFVGCSDKSMQNILNSYGFFCGVDVTIINFGKKGFVVDVLGSKFSINSKLAEVILVCR